MNRKKRRVALLIDTSTTWGRGLIQGIARYARESADWSLTVEARGVFEKKALPYNWVGDGVIGRLTSAEIIESIRQSGVPAINCSQIRIPGSDFSQVTTDESLVGRLAAEHLLERRFSSFGYYGPPHRPHYTDQIYASFAKGVDQAGRSLSVFQPDRYFVTGESSHDDLRRIERWFEELEMPAGVLTWNAWGAQCMATACELLGVRIPEEIGILAGENDDLISMVAPISLSSIDHNPQRVGWHAASALHRIFQGAPARDVGELLPPASIVMGDTTRGVPLRDPAINLAVRFINDHLDEPIGVVDIAKAAGVSRRALEVRFRDDRGRSPGEELRIARIARARQLLVSGRQTLNEIANQTGFCSATVLSRAFTRVVGVSPRTYRSRHWFEPNISHEPFKP